ncbi:HNH endonuclease [Terrisporobacter petrolearius]|uniref:HNH endonuclease n=1 Tax=Terrisporobacter petrolearius TaxID=1460447 RepID=UPI003EB7C616
MHIKSQEGNEELFWDESNWEALCKSCHDKKTAKEDGRGGKKEESILIKIINNKVLMIC